MEERKERKKGEGDGMGFGMDGLEGTKASEQKRRETTRHVRRLDVCLADKQSAGVSNYQP